MNKIFISLILVSIVTLAQPCTTDIYTGNGIDTTKIEAEENKNKLQRVMKPFFNPSQVNFKFIHNPTNGRLEDMQETYYGLLESGQISKGFFNFMFSLSTLTSNEEEALKQYIKIITTYDIDVSSITKAYRENSFNKQNNVLLVAHSQGNIVGNKVYTQLTSTQKSKFRMVSVGTPANYVSGGGPHVTGYLDFVINNPFIPNSLPANTQVFGHNFISNYLSSHENDKGRDKIVQHVINAYNNLSVYTGCSRYDSIHLYVNGVNDTVLAKGKIRGINSTEIISKQTVEAREVDDECKEYPKITGYSDLYPYSHFDFLWRISPFQTQEEVQANQSATLKYKNFEGKCVDISFQETVYDVVYQGLAK